MKRQGLKRHRQRSTAKRLDGAPSKAPCRVSALRTRRQRVAFHRRRQKDDAAIAVTSRQVRMGFDRRTRRVYCFVFIRVEQQREKQRKQDDLPGCWRAMLLDLIIIPKVGHLSKFPTDSSDLTDRLLLRVFHSKSQKQIYD